MKDGKKYWSYIKKYKPTLLSSPSRGNSSILGKKQWVKNNLPTSKLILTSAKDKNKYATSNSILIDYYETNVEEWKGAGGIGILHTNIDSTIKQLKKLGL